MCANLYYVWVCVYELNVCMNIIVYDVNACGFAFVSV